MTDGTVLGGPERSSLRLGELDLPLRDQIRSELRDRIINGVYSPGARLVERELAADLGVSRVPVREALRVLQAEGFVEERRRRGLVVSRLSRQDLVELFDVREALEVLCARRAAERLTEDDVVTLRDIQERAESAHRRGDDVEVARANNDLHDKIVATARNGLLAAMLEPLLGRLHWLLRQNDQPSELLAEHRQLVDAVTSGDPDRAAAVALAHIARNREIALRIIATTGDAADAAS